MIRQTRELEDRHSGGECHELQVTLGLCTEGSVKEKPECKGNKDERRETQELPGI